MYLASQALSEQVVDFSRQQTTLPHPHPLESGHFCASPTEWRVSSQDRPEPTERDVGLYSKYRDATHTLRWLYLDEFVRISRMTKNLSQSRGFSFSVALFLPPLLPEDKPATFHCSIGALCTDKNQHLEAMDFRRITKRD